MDGFNTFEKQDKILLGLNSGSDAAAALRILQQQGFAVQTFTVENAVSAAELLQLLTDKAAELDCAFIATGHFARIEAYPAPTNSFLLFMFRPGPPFSLFLVHPVGQGIEQQRQTSQQNQAV